MTLQKAERGARTPLKDVIWRFLGYTARFSDNTQRQYRDVLWRFFERMPEYVELITPEHVERYISSLRVLNSSKNTILIPIKSLFTYLHEYYGIKNVAKKVKNLKTQPVKRRVISEIELEKILAVASIKEQAIVKFLAKSTGLRLQEFCDLTPESVSDDQRYIRVIGKGNRLRIVPLNATARECLPLIFAKRYSRDMISSTMKRLGKKAGIPPFYTHALRHYWVTAMIKKGVNRFIIAKIAGHSVEVLERIYCHLLIPDFLGATDVLDE